MNSEEQPVIEQRAELPPGSIPKNRQTWIMLGMAAVIVLAVVFSGSSDHRETTASRATAPVNAPDRAEIERYTQALRTEEQRLRQAQAEASRSRDAFQQQVGGTGMQGAIPGQGGPGQNGEAVYPGTPVPPQRNAVEEDREKREYASAFASNIALSFRKAAEDRAMNAGADAADTKESAGEGNPSSPKRNADDPSRASASGSSRSGYTLLEGTIIEAVLTNRLEGSFSGPVNCQTTTDVYSHDRQHLLIPRGSRVLGEARRVEEDDQQRLAVVFHRLILPDGYSVSFDRMAGLDQGGATGLKDKVNHHYASTFGTSVALGLLAGLSVYGTGSALTAGGADMYRQGVASQVGRDSTRILDRQLNRLPAITIREGTRVKILLAGDLSLPGWLSHLPTSGVEGES